MAGGRTRVKQIHARAEFGASAQLSAWRPLPSRATSRAIADTFSTLLPCSTLTVASQLKSSWREKDEWWEDEKEKEKDK